MPRLTLSDTIKTVTEDIKLRLHLHHEQIMALCHDRDYMRKELSDVSYCLAQQLTINDLHNERMDQQSRQIQRLTRLAEEQADTIAALTGKLEELAEAYDSTADEVEMLHQWLDRQQQRIVALEKRDSQTFTLTESNSRRIDLQGAWITELFNRLNDHVNNEE